MKNFEINRVSSSIMGVFGVLTDSTGWIVGTTAERPQLGNKTDISCINAGAYRCTKYFSPSRGYFVILLHDVEGREFVEMHIGNKPMIDSKGCILVGSGFGFWDGQPTVSGSTKAFDKLMEMAAEEFTLTIKESF